MSSRLVVLALCLGGLTVLPGCTDDPSDDAYAARVGDFHLTEEEVSRALQSVPVNGDTIEARRQIIEQWVSRTLLHQEALRLNLEDDPAVQERLAEQERAVLVNALTTQLYEAAEIEPSDSDIRRYFEQNRDRMQLREPHLLLRHVRTAHADTADTIGNSIAEDNAWEQLCTYDVVNAEQTCQVGQQFFPEHRRFNVAPFLRSSVEDMEVGETRTLERDTLYHIVHLADRADAGEAPEIEWVAPEIRRRLKTRARKQMHAREVQRLRNEARARNDLEISTVTPSPPSETAP